MANTPTKYTPKILDRAMTYNARLDYWRWTPRSRTPSRSLSVAIYKHEGKLVARIWALGIPTAVDEIAIASVKEGAKWADKKIRGLVRALGVVET